MKTYSIEHTPMKILLEPEYFSWRWKTYKIPAWYAFDGLSIPQVFQGIVNMNDTDKIKAWLDHDWLYSDVSQTWITRYEADMKLDDDIWWHEWKIMFLWVRIWWLFSYKQDRNYKKYKKEIEEAREKLNLKSLT